MRHRTDRARYAYGVLVGVALAGVVAIAVSSSGAALSAPTPIPRFTPGAQELILRNDNGPSADLFALSPRGAMLKRLVRTSESDEQPTVSPDGRRIAYVRRRIVYAGGPFLAPETATLHVMDVDGRNDRVLERVRPGTNDTAPSWSPDGTRIAFIRRIGQVDRLHVVNADGSRVHRLPYAPAPAGRPSWTPDGRQIVVPAKASVYELGPAEGRVMRRLAFGARHITPWLAAPSWSPDGRWFALVRFETCAGPNCYTPSLYIFRAQEPARPVLVSDVGLEPAWRPDSGQLTYVNLNVAPSLQAYDLRTKTTATFGPSVLREARAPSWVPRCDPSGTPRADRLVERHGGRLVCARAGNDAIESLVGNDHIFAGEGNDVIRATNGNFDLIACGSGLDSVIADARDHIATDCERTQVDRSG